MDFNEKVMLVTECARKAEVRLLQLKLEIGLGILKNAHEDSQRKIDEFELGRKRYAFFFENFSHTPTSRKRNLCT